MSQTRKKIRLLPALLLLVGVSLFAGMNVLELLEIGEIGWGPVQITWAIIGIVIALSGVLLTTGRVQKYFESWEEPLESIAEPSLRVLRVALWFALLTGLVEIIVLAYSKYVSHHTIGMGDHFVWMTPLSNLLIFVTPALVLGLLAWRWQRFNSLFIGAFVSGVFFYFAILLYASFLHRYAALLLAAGLAIQTARLISSRPHSFHRVVRSSTRAMIVILLMTGLGWLGWGWLAQRRVQESSTASRPNAPNVLLLVMDTVRAPSLSLYGYSRPTTPNLEKWARSGIVFDAAVATSSWTLPSHASMFTGRFRHELSVDRIKPGTLNHTTLAEVLTQNGYRTGGFVGNLNYCTEERGLARGFSHYEDFPVNFGQVVLSSSLGRVITDSSLFRRVVDYHDMLNDKDACELNGDFLEWLSKDEKRPFFAFLNYYDAHEPYLPPAGFDNLFGPTQPRGAFTYQSNDIERAEKWKMSAEEIAVEQNAYDGSIAYLDHEIGRLLDELNGRGLLNNTIVIVTSDHGEQFGERPKLFGHGNSLYYSSVHVPLLLMFPQKLPAGLRVNVPVTLRDLASTITDILDLSDHSFPGNSLARHWTQPPNILTGVESPVLSEVGGGFGESWYPNFDGEIKSIVVGPYHLIKDTNSIELYHVDRDPFELNNLASSEEGKRILKHLQLSDSTAVLP